MTTQVADVILHIDETLPLDQVKTLEKHLHNMGGILKASNHEDKPNLIQVIYDPKKVQSHDILLKVEGEGVHAELIGL
jgi:hypothetical protein